MRKRLRKKLHMGEFRQFGFMLSLVFCGETDTAEECESFEGLIIGSLCKPHGFEYSIGFWPPDYFEVFLVPSRGSTTDEQRVWVEAWLRSRGEVLEYHVGHFIDAYHDLFREDDSLWNGSRGPLYSIRFPRTCGSPCFRAVLGWLARDGILFGETEARQDPSTTPQLRLV
ncbi:MAG: 50S ribosome-binding protein YggL [Candidatus Eisenbacteria bacterium]